MFGADRVQQAVGGFVDEGVDAFKAAAKVGVGNFADGVGGGVVEEGADDGGAGAEGLHVAQVLVIHGQDVIKGVEVLRGEQAAEVAVLDVVLGEQGAGAVVGRLADVPRTGAGGVGLDFAAQASSADFVLKDAFGHRRAADIAKADE